MKLSLLAGILAYAFQPFSQSDGTLDRDLIFGNAPDSLKFDLSQWEDLH